jgi:hypothetical protein
VRRFNFLLAIFFASFAAQADIAQITCTVHSWLKSGEAQPEQKINIDLKDGPYGSRFGSSVKTLDSGEQLSLNLTQIGLSGPRTVWRLEVTEVGSKPQISSGEASSDRRINRLLLRSELDQKTLEVSCPL